MRLRFRYSLRVFFFCWILLGIGLAWGGIQWRAGQRQAAAVATLRNSWDCYVKYAGYDPPSPTNCIRHPHPISFSQRMINRFGVDSFYDVERLELYESDEHSAEFPFDQWEILLAFPKLKHLEIMSSRILVSHSNWQDEPLLTESFHELAQLRHLEHVRLYGFYLNKTHLAVFHNHSHLKVLDLRASSIQPDALSGLGELPQLESLRFWMGLDGEWEVDSALVKDGLEQFTLPPCPNLRLLDLSNAPCTEHIMQGLSKYSQLETLYLSEFKVTPALLASLRKLTQLKHLSLHYTKVSDQDCAQVVRALPNLEVLDLGVTSADEETLLALMELSHLRAVKLNGALSEKEGQLEAFSRQRPDVVFSSVPGANWIEDPKPDPKLDSTSFPTPAAGNQNTSFDPFALLAEP